MSPPDSKRNELHVQEAYTQILHSGVHATDCLLVHNSADSFYPVLLLTSCKGLLLEPTTSKRIGKGPAMNADQLATAKESTPCNTVTVRQFHSLQREEL